MKNLFFKKNEKIVPEPKELEKLNKMLVILHVVFLPFVEGITACLSVAVKAKGQNNVEIGATLRHICKSINSLSRVLDRLIISENKTYEQYTWAVILVGNIVDACCVMSKYMEAMEAVDRNGQKWYMDLQELLDHSFDRGFENRGSAIIKK